MTPPLVSVVMPVRDAAPYVRDAVGSILGQSLRDLELIAVDDGSTDGSGPLLAELAAGDARMRVVAGAGSGLTAALVAGVAAAGGRYLARMDADDVSLPDRLELQVARLDADPGLAACGGAVTIIDGGGRAVASVRYPVDDVAIRRRLERSNAFAHPAVTMRRDAYEAVGGYRLANGEDYDLWLRLAERYSLANLDRIVLLYRQHGAQYSVARIDDQAIGVLAAQYAARARRSGRRDPIPADGTLTREVLAELGLGERTVAEAQAAHRLRWAATLEQLGERQRAEALYDAARARSTASAAAFEARRDVARAHAALSSGRRRRAAAALARAFLAHPLALPGELARTVRSRRSFEAT